MSRNEEGESVPPVSSSNRARERRHPFLVACRCFSLLTGLAAILCIVVNVLSAIKSFRHISVMTRAFPNFGGERIEVIFQNVACYMLLACGVLYVVSGILCIGFMKRAREQKETLREQAAKDLEELEGVEKSLNTCFRMKGNKTF